MQLSELHDSVTNALGTATKLKTSPALEENDLCHLGFMNALIKTVNRWEKDHWSEKKKGFDFVLIDMGPHPCFFNLLVMMRYVDFDLHYLQ